jgi:hypothetical protein
MEATGLAAVLFPVPCLLTWGPSTLPIPVDQRDSVGKLGRGFCSGSVLEP